MLISREIQLMKKRSTSGGDGRASREREGELTNGQLKVRLDAIVMLLAGLRFSDENGTLKQKPVAKVLHNAGFTPTEIAVLLGKKRATQVSSYLY